MPYALYGIPLFSSIETVLYLSELSEHNYLFFLISVYHSILELTLLEL